MSHEQFNGSLPGPNGLPSPGGNMNGGVSPVSSTSSSSSTSYVVLTPSMTNIRGNHDMSYLQTLGGQTQMSQSLTDISIEHALVKIEEVSRENQELRETLKENNEMMKRQFATLAQWKERVRECNAQNLKKFDEQRKNMLDLQKFNQEMKQRLSQMQVEHAEMKNLEAENIKKSKEVEELKKRIDELTILVQSSHDDTFEPAETVIVSRSVEDPVKIEQLQGEKDNLLTRIIQLEAQVRLFREQNDQILQDMEKLQRLKEQIQMENSKLNEENNQLQKKLQSFLSDMQQRKHMLGNSGEGFMHYGNNSRQYDYSMVDIPDETKTRKQTAGVQTSAARQDMEFLEMQTAAADRCESFSQTEERNDNTFSVSDTATELREKLQSERQLVGQLKSKIASQNTQLENFQAEMHQKTQMLEHYKQQLDRQVAQVLEENQLQKQELMQQLDMLQKELQQTKQFSQHTGDIQSLKSQVLTLINEVQESNAKLDVTSKALDRKSTKVVELEQKLSQQAVMSQKERGEADMIIESLRTSLTSYEEAYKREQVDHAETKKFFADLKCSFNKLVSDYKELLDTFDQSKALQSQQNPQTLEEINRLTAQIIAAEEAIAYRDEQIKELKEQNARLKDDLETTVPVLKAQADIWKQDFDAEREAREMQHTEKERILADMKNLEIQNQQLIEEIEQLSKKSLAEMQQRHAHGGTTYQRQVQNQLQPQQHHQYPNQPTTRYSPQIPAHHGNSELINHGVRTSQQSPTISQPSSRASGGSQEEGEPQMTCPKCGLPCPDLDTLQIHVLECLE
ncbi:hypothetical protein CHS0354_027842 [Potamilus streckersoni]|uniref:CCHC NOA-type domain-containing protein n=1 Tax=Potamilus streckersoni TaxID=2493646 RepID=A0AAE0T0K3_9BIVA|nr:hypothetical protein CHS0354_027842 [Potamilus streckersoni]